MKITRQNVFETNSSSSHSITICRSNKLLNSITPDSNGIIILNGGKFGWGPEDYNDPLTKANYCAVGCLGMETYTERLINVIKEHTGAKHVIINIVDYNVDDENYSYIDHQSYDVFEEAFNDDETLKAFIFNPKSELRISHDNM